MSNRVRGVGSKKNSSNWRKTRSESGRVTYEKVNNVASDRNDKPHFMNKEEVMEDYKERIRECIPEEDLMKIKNR